MDLKEIPKNKVFKGWWKYLGGVFADIVHKYVDGTNHYLYTAYLQDGTFAICYKKVKGFKKHEEFIKELLLKPQAPNADMVGISDTIQIRESDINFDLLDHYKRITTQK